MTDQQPFDLEAFAEPLKFAYWVPNVSGDWW